MQLCLVLSSDPLSARHCALFANSILAPARGPLAVLLCSFHWVMTDAGDLLRDPTQSSTHRQISASSMQHAYSSLVCQAIAQGWHTEMMSACTLSGQTPWDVMPALLRKFCHPRRPICVLSCRLAMVLPLLLACWLGADEQY